MRFCSLGSGSRGNATLVEAGRTRVLVDCGFPLSELERRLDRVGVAPADLAAVLVTHEHGDHIRGVGPLARRHGVPVWMTPGTHAAANVGRLPRWHDFNGHEPFAIGDIRVCPFPVPHDARQPVQFVLEAARLRLGLLTDTGRITAHVRASLDGCDALLLECNHCPEMLAGGPYPPTLKARVGGDLGHLSNAQAARLLARLDRGRLRRVVAAHLSETNNTPQRAEAALAAALGADRHLLTVADQAAGFPWIALA